MTTRRPSGSASRSGQVAKQKRRAFHADQAGDVQAGRPELGPELVGPVGIADERAGVHRRDLTRPLQRAQHGLQVGELLVPPPAQHVVQAHGPAVDRRGEDRCAGPGDPPRFGQRRQPVRAPLQVVERAEQQHRVHAGAGQVQVPGVRHRGVDARVRGPVPLDLGHVQRHQIPVHHLVAQPGQPVGVPTRAATDVGHHRGGGRQIAEHDLLGPFELELPGGPIGQPGFLFAAFVVGAHRGQVLVVGHGAIFARPSGART